MKPGLAFIAMALGAAAAPASAQLTGSIDEMARTPIVTVRIAETLRAPPNEATLSLAAETKAPTAIAALADNKIKTERLLAAARAAGIVEKDIQTQGVNINPDYVYDRQPNGEGRQRLVGYAASNTVQIKTRRLDRLSSLLDSLTAAGVDRVNGPYFGLADRAPQRKEARKRAMVRGEAEATEYAVNAGFTRVRMLSVEEGVSSRSNDYIVVTGSRAGAPPPPPPATPERDGGSIQIGQIETSVTLTLLYRMER